MNNNLTEYPIHRERLYPCQCCGRQFNKDALNKHQTICGKIINKKRKLFDAGKQRAHNSDVPYKATRKTAQIYRGELRANDDRSKNGSKSNWREKHRQLIQSIREARLATRAVKQGEPLPASRPSEISSDYINCPYCHRNFNQRAAQRHVSFCQAQRKRKVVQSSNPGEQYDRKQTVSPRKTHQLQQRQPYSKVLDLSSNDTYNSSHKQSDSASMNSPKASTNCRQSKLSAQLSHKSSTITSHNKWNPPRLFGVSPKPQSVNSNKSHLSKHRHDDIPSSRLSHKQSRIIRTGRTQEHTNLNKHARQRYQNIESYFGRTSPARSNPTSHRPIRYPYSSSQYNSMKPIGIVRPPPPIAIRCGECGSRFTIASLRYCPHCGARR